MAHDRRTNASTPVTEISSIGAEERTIFDGPVADNPVSENPVERGIDPTGSVLICDDRPATGRELSQTFRRFLPSIVPVSAQLVADGFALVDAYQAAPADLVLIGIHTDSTAGIDAINLLLGLYPDAKTVVYGSVADVELLAAAYAQGAGGLLVWEPTDAGRPTQQQVRSSERCARPAPRPARSHRR